MTTPNAPKYPKVERAHIVPKAYLRFFAVDGQIGLRLVERAAERITTSIDNAAVRKRFYRRKRPDGSEIDDVEWSLSHIESALPPVLTGIEQKWPLATQDKAIVAEFFGTQFVRSPAFAAWIRRNAEEEIAKFESAGQTYLRSGKKATPEEREQAIRELSEGTRLFSRMLSLAPKTASAFGSMHWSLVRFDRPVLATSDHPVVRWPIYEPSRHPAREPDGLGLMNLLEVRVALKPDLALLMTWLDVPDRDEPLHGRKHHVENLNAFVVAQAETQWFHRPGANPRVGTGRFLPLSADLLPGYNGRRALASQRRQRVEATLNRSVGKDFEREFEIVTMR